MITPTIGRVVLVRNRPHSLDWTVAEPALVCRVWNEGRYINVGGFDGNGTPFSCTSVLLIQDDEEPPPAGVYAEWMPFQKGQAKAANLEELRRMASAGAPLIDINKAR